MRILIAAVLLLSACGTPDDVEQRTAPVSRDWSVELTGVCKGTMTTSQTDTLDTAQMPYASYYSGTWSCGAMSGPMNGAADARTGHFDLLLTHAALSFHAVGIRSAAGLSGTVGLQAGDVAFAAR